MTNSHYMLKKALREKVEKEAATNADKPRR
jgi:hypothetical protein